MSSLGAPVRAARRDHFAARSWKMALVCMAAALLAGCATPARTGPSLLMLAKNIGSPKPGHARVVVLRRHEFATLFDVGWMVHIDQAPIGDLKTGTFVYRDVPAGTHKLTFARPGDLFRASHQEFAATSAATYFIRLEMNEKGRMVTGAGSQGLAGLFISSAIAAAVDERGLFDFVPLDEATAQQEIAQLRLADPPAPTPSRAPAAPAAPARPD